MYKCFGQRGGWMSANNWDAHLYDRSHRFVSEYGNHLIELLAPQKDEKVLDIGCGTGDLANELYEHGINVIGIDYAESMVEQAQQKYPHIRFEVGDITQLPYEDEFDAILSNAVLHWIKSPKLALESIYQSLQSGGRFVAEFGGKGNVSNLTTNIIREVREAGYAFDEKKFPWYFPSIAAYTILMEQVGFQVTFARLYERPTRLVGDEGLKNWLSMFADSFFHDVPVDKRDVLVKQIEQALSKERDEDGNWLADYVRLQIIGKKI